MEFRIHAMTSGEYFDDPVAAYDRLAPNYASVSRRREAYLQSVEKIIASRIPADSRSLLDVGAGDGTRAIRIAKGAAIWRIVLVEPSAAMAARATTGAEVWRVRAQDLSGLVVPERFDAITCLWNVLGHIPSSEKRLAALHAIVRLLSPCGTFFLDVNHRYNARAYGVIRTLIKFLHDQLFRNERNGDVLATWNFSGHSISTYGHVFSRGEITRMAFRAGLELLEQIVVDYDNGSVRPFAFQGNLLYIFRRSSRIDSSKAPHTS